MRRAAARALCVAAALVLALGGCDRLRGLGAKPSFDKAALEAALDPAVGGPDTCLVIKEVASGRQIYQYGAPSACNRPLPPCGSFQIPMTLIGLSDGKVRPGETWGWGGAVQPYKAWEHDMDLAAAWRSGAAWWFQKLALAIGRERFGQQLSAMGYGQGEVIGRPDAFWMGPAAGGGLYLSTHNQAEVLRKLARGALPVKPEAAQAVLALMADATRGQTRLSGLGASCPSTADAGRDVSWWVGRIQSPGRDLVFALSIDSDNPMPGFEIRNRVLPILARFGFLPEA